MKKLTILFFCITLLSSKVIKAQCVADFTISSDNCTGLPVTINFAYNGTSNNGCLTFKWNFGDGSPTSNSQDPIHIFATAGPFNVVLTVTNPGGFGCGGGCGGGGTTVTKVVNITPKPNVSFTSTAPKCVNVPVDYTNTASNSGQDSLKYNWDFGANASPRISTAENPKGIVYAVAGTKTVTFQIINSVGCINTVTQNISIKSTPDASFTSTAPQCTGLPVDFTDTDTTSGATAYSWNFGSAATPATLALQNPTGVIYSTAGSKIVSFLITNSTTGCSNSITQTINVNQTPTATFTSNAPKCVGAEVDYTNTGSTGGNWSYAWDLGADASPKLSTSENPKGISYASGGDKTVTVTVYDGVCTKTATQTIITINALPLANAGMDTIICPNTSVQIGSAAIAGNTYKWFPTSTLSAGGISNPVSAPIAGNSQYFVTVTTLATGCINTDTINVTMLPSLIPNAGVDGVICRYDSIQIGAGILKGQRYIWSPAAGLSSITLPNPVASPDSTTTYKVTVSGDYLTSGVSCPIVTDNVKVTVHQLPLAEAGPNDTITIGSSTQLTATGGIQYVWSPSKGLNNIGIFDPVADPVDTTDYTVTVIDVYGCINTDTMKVYVINASVWLPMAFTPDGNGANDVLFVRGSGILHLQFAVFSCWGEQLFSTTDIKQGWDGTRQSTGEQMPQGAYAYIVKGVMTDGKPVDEKGLVNLIK